MDTKIYTDEQKLSIMYEGDKARDATDKIRGFLFQDFVTIMCLLQKNVKYVCSEYIEDVDVFFEDNTFEFIQVKYYPKTRPNMKEILTDLYYQYLRLEMLQSTLKVSPKLYIHGKSKVKKLEITDMKTYIGLENNLHKSASYLNVAESVKLLRTDIYSTNKKSEQKEKLFGKMASEKSLEGFVSKFNIVQQEDINCYKQKLMEKLAEEYKNPDEYEDEEKWQLILLGLAISYIQRRYVLEKELKDFFGEFITNYDEQKQIAENLDIFAEDVERYIEDKTKQKVSQDLIKNQEEEFAKTCEEAKKIPYPATIFYPNEKIEIVELNKAELTEQKKEVENCGYLIVEERLFKLIKNEALKNQQRVIKEIVSYWETKSVSIQRAVKAGLWKSIETITNLEEKLKKLKTLSLSKDSILQDGEYILALESAGFTKVDFDADKQKINEKQKKVKALSDEIDLLSKNNKMLKLLSSLLANKQVVIEHRNNIFKEKGSVRCPICGSELFATMDEEMILKEADTYIEENGKTVSIKEADKITLQNEIEILYQNVINRAKLVVENEEKTLELKSSNLKILKDEIQPYFSEVKELQKTRKEINAENLTAEMAKELLAGVEEQLLGECKEQEIKEGYQQILTVLGYKFENETVQQTYEKVKNIIKKSYVVSSFSYDIFVSKLNAIDSILANKTLSDLRKKIEENTEKNKILDTEIEELQELKDIASQRAKDIRDAVEKLSQDEYKRVGPALGKFYNKLARFNSNEGINIIPEKEGISLVDNNGKNIVNILSNGQISVFMLAHFFASINVRNDREKMKIYFIDDLTACMDDVNMLAFMDLLKYQMSSKATMEQLFFATCDNRISNLLKYKLDGRGIEFCELLESDFE